MKRKDRANFATLGVLGFFSGAIAWGLILLTGVVAGEGSYLSRLRGGDEIGPYTVRVIPGLVFGLIIGFLWHRRGMISRLGVLGYAAASAVAYLLAFEFALHTFDQWPGLTENVALALSGIIAGFIGCCVLGIAVVFLLRVSVQSALGRPVLVGAAAGVLLPLINLDTDGGVGIGWLLFYGLWQGAYAASSARLMASGFTKSHRPR